MRKLFKKKLAFTLAEVLIVLGIIGIIAELTVPALYANFQKKLYVLELQKSYSQMAQVFKLYMANEGVTDLSQTSLFATDDNDAKLNEILKKYIKIAKFCDPSDENDESCVIKEWYLGDWFNEDIYPDYHELFTPSFYTPDNMAYEIYTDPISDCKPDYRITSNMKGRCIEINVDVNGQSPPNKEGRDYFAYWNAMSVASDGNVYPMGSREMAQFLYFKRHGTTTTSDWNLGVDGEYWKTPFTTSRCGAPGSTDVGNVSGDVGCAARIRDEGWKMIY